MRINLVKIGKSKAVIIPAALLASCELTDTIDLQVKDKKLVIAAIKSPRVGWFDNHQAANDEVVPDSIPAGADSYEWQW